tara:strand:- start:758 stop:1534 length:777 start_codon:yes stop_codon:yes gene_type:complete
MKKNEEIARERYNPDRPVASQAREIARDLGANPNTVRHYLIAKRRDFPSLTDYQNNNDSKRINPKTNKPFGSPKASRDYWARKKGFRNGSHYVSQRFRVRKKVIGEGKRSKLELEIIAKDNSRKSVGEMAKIIYNKVGTGRNYCRRVLKANREGITATELTMNEIRNRKNPNTGGKFGTPGEYYNYLAREKGFKSKRDQSRHQRVKKKSTGDLEPLRRFNYPVNWGNQMVEKQLEFEADIVHGTPSENDSYENNDWVD